MKTFRRFLRIAGCIIASATIAARHDASAAQPKKGPLATKMEREGRGAESLAIRDWHKVNDRNLKRAELRAAKKSKTAELISLEEERLKRKPVESEGMDPDQDGYDFSNFAADSFS